MLLFSPLPDRLEDDSPDGLGLELDASSGEAFVEDPLVSTDGRVRTANFRGVFSSLITLKA